MKREQHPASQAMNELGNKALKEMKYGREDGDKVQAWTTGFAAGFLAHMEYIETQAEIARVLANASLS